MASSPDATTQQKLAIGHRRCEELTRRHGTTYYWGARLLPIDQRRDVHAVYALCRLADDIVDEPETVDLALPTHPDPATRLRLFKDRFFADLERGTSDEPVMAAVVESVNRTRTPVECFERFYGAMELDLVRDTWATWPDLRDGYMEGSAAVIGELMIPVLRPRTLDAIAPARSLGLAFQLTNFLRDVGEDLDRGRVYLPQDELQSFGVDIWQRTVTPEWRALMAHQIRRNRDLYREAVPGIAMLPPPGARCVMTALRMYSLILDRIEAADFDVFSARARVPSTTKLAIATDVVVRGPYRTVPRLARL